MSESAEACNRCGRVAPSKKMHSAFLCHECAEKVTFCQFCKKMLHGKPEHTAYCGVACAQSYRKSLIEQMGREQQAVVDFDELASK